MVLAKLDERINEIQEWLSLGESSTEAWRQLSTGCVLWCVEKHREGKISNQDVTDQFPLLWTLYLQDTGLSDEIKIVWSEAGSPAESNE